MNGQRRGAVDLYWLPLGAGGHSVRLNGRVFEAVLARLEKRPAKDLYHSALVVRAPEDSTLALKGGDVIVSIGGRKPTSPMQAMRIIRSYDPGESVTLDVLRKQKRVTVTWKVPEREKTMFRRTPRMHEEPTRFRVAPKIRASWAI